MTFLTDHESSIRLGVFIGVLAVMAILEVIAPRKKRVAARAGRWLTNLGLIVIDTLALRFLMPLFAMGMAAIASDKGWGLLNMIDAPVWLEITLAVIVLDMLIYWQHVASHHIPLIWALHQVHHADRDIDATTGIRFHPLEILLSMGYKLICVMLLGPAVVAVFIFEVLLNACAMFNHANVKLPTALDRLIRLVLVTPDMHRVHHSVIPAETNSNYGFSLSIWDRVFGSYIAQPQKGHDGMTIGLSQYQTNEPSTLKWCLLIPFKFKRTLSQKETA